MPGAAQQRPPALMFQGTGSNVGKSLLVTGLCRAYAARGLRVRPFKPQNMSNNAAVTADGREIGRAQALQARAAGIAPSAHMNPVLLKPESEHGAQVVVQGSVTGSADARRYHALKAELMPHVLESFRRLGRGADLILVEGAGSPAEVNLRENDIANMGFALAARVPVALVGDVDRGGVIASLVGTAALLPAPERALTQGLPHQQVPRRSHPLRRRQYGHRGEDGLGAARPYSLVRGRAAAAGRGQRRPRFHAAAAGGRHRRRHQDRRPPPAAHLQHR